MPAKLADAAQNSIHSLVWIGASLITKLTINYLRRNILVLARQRVADLFFPDGHIDQAKMAKLYIFAPLIRRRMGACLAP
jgi:hypothetical protein